MCLLPAPAAGLAAAAARLLPVRQAEYDACCATLLRVLSAAQPNAGLRYAVQNSVRRALSALNEVRGLCGLPLLPGPELLSFDEVLAWARLTTA